MHYVYINVYQGHLFFFPPFSTNKIIPLSRSAVPNDELMARYQCYAGFLKVEFDYFSLNWIGFETGRECEFDVLSPIQYLGKWQVIHW